MSIKKYVIIIALFCLTGNVMAQTRRGLTITSIDSTLRTSKDTAYFTSPDSLKALYRYTSISFKTNPGNQWYRQVFIHQLNNTATGGSSSNWKLVVTILSPWIPNNNGPNWSIITKPILHFLSTLPYINPWGEVINIPQQ